MTFDCFLWWWSSHSLQIFFCGAWLLIIMYDMDGLVKLSPQVEEMDYVALLVET